MASSEDIFREYRAPLARHLQRQVGDPSIAEDLLQETFIRAALILHDLEDMDGAQTAEVLGLSQGAARVRAHRARARLKAALQESCGFYRDSNSVLRCTRRD